MSFGHRGRSEEDPHLVIEQGLRELCRLDTGTVVLDSLSRDPERG